MRAWRRYGSHGAAFPAGAMREARVEALEYRRKLRLDVRELEKFLVELRVAVLAVPLQTVALARPPPPFDDESDGIGQTLGRVGHQCGKQEDLAFTDGHVHHAAVLYRPQGHVPLDLVEELLAGIDVEVAARIGAAHHHHDQVAIRKQQLVAHGRPEQVAM